MVGILKKLNVKQKIITGFAIISSILILGMGFMLFEFTHVATLGNEIIDQHQPVTRLASKALEHTQSTSNHLHKFLLTGDANSIRDYYSNIGKLENDLKALQVYADDGRLVINKQELQRSHSILDEINVHAEHLRTLNASYEQNHPIIFTASSLLNPLALEYLGVLNRIIEENTDADIPRAALVKLTEMRHSWTQMMSSLRIALATHTARELINVQSYADVNQAHMEQLKVMNLDLGFEGTEKIEEIRDRYMINMKETVNLFNSSIWRMDAHLMTNTVMPLFDELKSYLDKIVNIQLLLSEQAGVGLTHELLNARYVYIALIIIGFAITLLISTIITRSLSKPIRDLANATMDVAQGDLDTEIKVSGNDEIAYLSDNFNDMVRNLKQSRKALTLARDEAQQASKAKSQFLARMSHELRTPLNAILGFAQLLEMDLQENPEEKEQVERILQAGWHLLELVNEILDLARIESSSISINSETIDILPLIQECLEIIRPMVRENNLELLNNISECNRYYLHVDSLRFKQIVLNLLSNAVKFNKVNGKVFLECDIKTDGILRISVRDNGPGLNEQEQIEVFIPFQRLDADEKAIGGTGIGLTITKSLVEMMEGQIGVESVPGKGSTFWIEFPVKLISSEVNQPALHHEVHTDLKGNYTVLYIEDDSANQQLVNNIFASKRPGINLKEAPTAEIGLEMAKQYLPQLILMDLNLPGLSGQEALARLQGDKRTSSIPVIALSAEVMPANIEKCKELGFVDFVGKPIRVTEFLGSVDDVLQYHTAQKGEVRNFPH